jgi:hypothetical protein
VYSAASAAASAVAAVAAVQSRGRVVLRLHTPSRAAAIAPSSSGGSSSDGASGDEGDEGDGDGGDGGDDDGDDHKRGRARSAAGVEASVGSGAGAAPLAAQVTGAGKRRREEDGEAGR